MNRLVRTELLKQRTTRTVVAALVAVPALVALVAAVVLDAAGKQGNDPLGPDSLVQVVGAPADAITLVALLLGVIGMAGEYRHQTITTTFLATPRRRDVVLAKLGAHAITGAVLGLLSVVTALVVAVPWLVSSDVAIDVDARLIGVSLGVVASTALYMALGVSVGALVRNQTAAVGVVLGWVLAVEGILGDVFAGAAFVDWLPAAVGRAIVHGCDLPAGVGVAAFAAYVAGFAVLATRFTVRRDVT